MSGEFSGRLKERVRVAKVSGARDDLGADTAPWTEFAPVWAEIAPKGRGPAVDADKPLARPRYQISLRRTNDAPGVGDRIIWKECELHVLSVTDDPRMPERLQIIAEVRP